MEDEALISRVAGGDVGAFSELYDRHAQRVFAWSAHVLGPGRAEDAIQEIFLRLWQHAAQFDSRRGTFAAWFTAIARHHLVHELRREGMRRRMDAATELGDVLAAAPSPEPLPDEAAFEREDAAALRRALRLLPEEQRQVVVLAYFTGLSQSQIADQLALPLGTVKKRVRLGMSKLRTALEPGFEDATEAAGDPPTLAGATD